MSLRSRIKAQVQTALGTMGVLAPAEHAGRTLRAYLTPTGRGIVDRFQRMNALYAQFIPPGSLVFDIGANMGTRVETALALGARRIVAVDPQERCIRYLRLKYRHNPRVSIVPKGIAAEPGTLTLYLSPTSGASTFSPAMRETHRAVSHIHYTGEATAELTTLDALIAEYGEPDFVKIDVEGFELEVLKGLSQPVTLVSFEAQPTALETAVACIERLESLGRYEYNIIAEERYYLELPTWVTAREMITFVREQFAATMGFGDVFARRQS
mgnify:CR=1 FL=1